MRHGGVLAGYFRRRRLSPSSRAHRTDAGRIRGMSDIEGFHLRVVALLLLISQSVSARDAGFLEAYR